MLCPIIQSRVHSNTHTQSKLFGTRDFKTEASKLLASVRCIDCGWFVILVCGYKHASCNSMCSLHFFGFSRPNSVKWFGFLFASHSIKGSNMCICVYTKWIQHRANNIWYVALKSSVWNFCPNPLNEQVKVLLISDFRTQNLKLKFAKWKPTFIFPTWFSLIIGTHSIQRKRECLCVCLIQ